MRAITLLAGSPGSEIPNWRPCSLRDSRRLCPVDDSSERAPEECSARVNRRYWGRELSLVGRRSPARGLGTYRTGRELFRERKKLRQFAPGSRACLAGCAELRICHPTRRSCADAKNVSYARLRRYASWRAAKLQTRCGMGPCQGRVVVRRLSSFQMESGFGSTTRFCPFALQAWLRSRLPRTRHQELQEGTDELGRRVASDTDLLHGRPRVDHSFMAGHCRWLLDNGSRASSRLGPGRRRDLVV